MVVEKRAALYLRGIEPVGLGRLVVGGFKLRLPEFEKSVGKSAIVGIRKEFLRCGMQCEAFSPSLVDLSRH